jgi:uncharacterized membrane protein
MNISVNKFLRFRENIYLYLIFFIFFVIFSWMSFLKVNNFGITFYDTGYYANLLENDPFEYLTNNHLSYILIPLSILTKILPWHILDELFIIQILAGLSPIFFFKKNYFLIFAYCLCPIVWFNILPNFHIDILAIPIIWFLIKANDEQKYILFFILSILLVSIKFFFFAIIFGFLLFNFFEKKNLFLKKKFIYLYLILLIYFLVNFYFNFNFKDISNDLIYIDPEKSFQELFNIKIFNISTFLIVVFGYFLFFPFFKNKYVYIILPTLFVYFFSTNNLNLSKFYYHYTVPLIPVIFYSINDLLSKKILFKFNFFQNYIKILFIFNIFFFNIIFSPSPISIMYWKNFNDFYYKLNYFTNKDKLLTQNFLNSLFSEHKKNNIVIENNILFKSSTDQNIQVFPNLLFNKNGVSLPADFIFLKNQDPHYMNGQKCKMFNGKCKDKKFILTYDKIINDLDNYSLLYEDINIKVLKLKN